MLYVSCSRASHKSLPSFPKDSQTPQGALAELRGPFVSLPSAQTALVKVRTAQSFPIHGCSPPCTCSSLRVRRGSPQLPCGLRVPGICCILPQGSDPSTPCSFSIFTALESFSGSTNRAFGTHIVYAASQLLSSLIGKTKILRKSTVAQV